MIYVRYSSKQFRHLKIFVLISLLQCLYGCLLMSFLHSSLLLCVCHGWILLFEILWFIQHFLLSIKKVSFPIISILISKYKKFHSHAVCIYYVFIAAAAAKSLQSCPTLCDPIDGSPSGSSIPGILQARTLEWVAISFSNAGK